jgi:hypothetical protein
MTRTPIFGRSCWIPNPENRTVRTIGMSDLAAHGSKGSNTESEKRLARNEAGINRGFARSSGDFTLPSGYSHVVPSVDKARRHRHFRFNSGSRSFFIYPLTAPWRRAWAETEHASVRACRNPALRRRPSFCASQSFCAMSRGRRSFSDPRGRTSFYAGRRMRCRRTQVAFRGAIRPRVGIFFLLSPCCCQEWKRRNLS